MLYMVTFTIHIPPMLAYIPAPWILWVTELQFDVVFLSRVMADDSSTLFYPFVSWTTVLVWSAGRHLCGMVANGVQMLPTIADEMF